MNIKRYIEIIKKEIPALKIENIEINKLGWDNYIVIINNSLVIRIPKNKIIEEKLEVEKCLLDLLSLKKIKLSIPKYNILRDEVNNCKLVYYDYIPGVSMSEISNINAIKTDKNAIIIADFLTKLHSTEYKRLIEIGMKCNYNNEFWGNLLLSIKNELFEYFTSEQRQDVIEFFQSYNSIHFKKSCIIHGDLSYSNILIDSNDNSVSGVIDFSDAQIYDPAFDFAGLYWDLGANFTKKVLKYYKGSEDVKDIYHRVKKFYGIQPVFHELLYKKRNIKNFNINLLMEKYNKLRNYEE